MRITGLATGLDMDEIIKNSMKPYRIKIQQQQQNKEVVEIKQKLYRDIISDASKFYDKYFDLTKSDSLLKSSSYKSVVFSSSSSSVSITGNSDTKAETYKITGSTAKPATYTIQNERVTIVINGKEFSLTGKDNTEKAKNLNDELKKAGINVTATASDFTGGNIVLESNDVGKNANFTVGGTTIEKTFSSKVGENATKTIVELSKSDITSGTIKIGDKDITFEDWESNDDKVKKINDALKDSGISAVKSGDGIKLTSTKTGSDSTFDVAKQDGSEIGIKTLGIDATESKVELSKGDITNKKITINGKSIYLNEENMRDSDSLTKALEGTGVKAEVNGTEITLISKSTGSNSKFNVIVKDTLGNSTIGESATAAEYTIQDKDIVDNKVTINGKTIDLSEADTIEKKVEQLNKDLSSSNMVAKVDGDNIILTSKVTGTESKISINGNVEAEGTDATNSTVTGLIAGKMIINGKEVDLNGVTPDTLKDKLKDTGVTGTIEDNGSITLTSIATGSNSSIDVTNVITGDEEIKPGEAGKITITNSSGEKIENIEMDSSNSVTIDGVTFKFNGPIDGETITVVGKNDVGEVKDKLVNFINDYNTLIEKLNTLTSTKHDKGYVPLTDEQKKEMSETEIKLWNEKVESGQLYKDSNLTKITDSLKSTMRTFMEGTGLNLQAIGISPVQDYSGTKNGTFNINEEKLTKALEKNMDDVMNLFIGNSEDISQKGIMLQLKETLYTEFKSSSSFLSKKVGVEGASTFSNNELTKNISQYEQKIKDMERDFSRREQALYSKYATLETMMNKLNAQQSNLMSQLGMG